jgi:hypothetical protein
MATRIRHRQEFHRRICKLPNDLKAFVETEFIVARDYRDFFAQSLRDDLAVERIGVVVGQIEEVGGMIHGVGQYAEVQILDGPLCVSERKSQFS